MSKGRFIASSSPHIRDSLTVPSIMRDVVIALLPAAIFGMFHFGYYAGLVILSGIAGAVLTEWIGCSVMHRPVSVNDWSAVITGILIGMGCPPYVPFWIPFVGSMFAIGIVKLPFGGLGHNFLNPALAGRAFLVASWPTLMTQWFPGDVAAAAVDAVSTATPLAAVGLGQKASYMDLFLGNIAGSIGEVCKIALIAGFVYLLVRRIVTINIPLGFLGTLFVFTWIFGGTNGLFTGDGLFAILSGGAIMVSLYMCNDYTTSPITPKGQLLMGVGAGLLTALIRVFGPSAEGVTYAVLFMNVVTPLIDRFIRPKTFGAEQKRAAGLTGGQS